MHLLVYQISIKQTFLFKQNSVTLKKKVFLFCTKVFSGLTHIFIIATFLTLQYDSRLWVMYSGMSYTVNMKIVLDVLKDHVPSSESSSQRTIWSWQWRQHCCESLKCHMRGGTLHPRAALYLSQSNVFYMPAAVSPLLNSCMSNRKIMSGCRESSRPVI